MNIVIVGGGVVGTATALGFQRLGHLVSVFDPHEECLAAQHGLSIANGLPLSLRRATIMEAHCVLVCVPESEAGKALITLDRRPSAETAIYIRSSVPPGTCKHISETWNRHVGHNAEFLREAVAEYEFLNPPGIILGDCCEEHGQVMHRLYEPFRVPIHHTNPTTSELLKLAVNGYLACQISFWHQVRLLADTLGVNSHQVGMLAAHCDDRVSVYGSRMHGRYGGRCLPKDLEQLLVLCQENHVYAPLFQAIKAINVFGAAL